MALEEAYCRLSLAECERILDVSRILIFTILFVIARILGRAWMNCLSSDSSRVRAFGFAICGCVLADDLHSDNRMDVSCVIEEAMAYLLEEVFLRKLFKMLYHGYKKPKRPIQTSLQFQTDHVNRLRAKTSHVRFLHHKALYLRNFQVPLQKYFQGQHGDDLAHQLPELHEMCLEVDTLCHEVHGSCHTLHKVCHELYQFCQSRELCNCMDLCSRINENEVTINTSGGNNDSQSAL